MRRPYLGDALCAVTDVGWMLGQVAGMYAACMLGMCIQQCGCVRVCPDRMDDSHRSYLMSLIVQILFAVSESRNFATLCNQGTGKG